MPNEQWLPIPGWEGLYEVSDCGRVRSLPLSYRTVGRQRGRILKAALDSKGYPIVRLCRLDGTAKTTKVHRAVALAFIGSSPEGIQVNHKNGVKTDNRVANLEYVTCRDNIRHAWNAGLYPHRRGESHNCARLTETDVRAIRAIYPARTLAQLASMFGVTKNTIHHVVKRKTWQHIA